MKRSLTTILMCAVLIALNGGSGFAGSDSNAATATPADASTPEHATKRDAMLRRDAAADLNPTAKIGAQNTKAIMKPQVLPPPDGNELATSCQAEVEGFDAGYCLGVVEGVIASMRVCKRDHSVITLGEAADATARYLSAHPDKLNDRDVVLARRALAKTYPCGPSRR